MLPQNNIMRGKAGATAWHGLGYTGKDINIAVIDGHGEPHAHMMHYIKDPLNTAPPGSGIGHLTNVTQVAHEFAPRATCYMFNSRSTSREKCIQWVVDNQDIIDVVNVSMGGIMPWHGEVFKPLEATGIPVICSSGNENRDRALFPARFPWAISVGAYVNNLGSVARYSNYCQDLDCVAFTSVWVPNSEQKPFTLTGTSCSAPTMSGLLALWCQFRKENGLPKLTAETVKMFLPHHCKDKYEPGHDDRSGHGLYLLPRAEETQFSALESKLAQEKIEVIRGIRARAKTKADILRMWKMTKTEASTSALLYEGWWR